MVFQVLDFDILIDSKPNSFPIKASDFYISVEFQMRKLHLFSGNNFKTK